MFVTLREAQHLSSLEVAFAGVLDLRDHDLLIDYSSVSPVGIWTGDAYDGISGMVKSGRITSSLASGPLKALAVAEARDALGVSGTQTDSWSGQTVDSTSVLVMYTWGGDANLDGKINMDDYGRVNSGVKKSGMVFGWLNGDFNYDGKINIDDYGIIDGNISVQDVLL